MKKFITISDKWIECGSSNFFITDANMACYQLDFAHDSARAIYAQLEKRKWYLITTENHKVQDIKTYDEALISQNLKDKVSALQAILGAGIIGVVAGAAGAIENLMCCFQRTDWLGRIIPPLPNAPRLFVVAMILFIVSTLVGLYAQNKLEKIELMLVDGNIKGTRREA